MSFEAVRQIVEKRFFDNYDIANPESLGAIPFAEAHDVVERTRVLDLADTPWLIVGLVDGGSRVRAFNKGMRKTSGFVRFTLFVQEGSGTSDVRRLSDYIDSIMGFQGGNSGTDQVGTLYTHVGQLKKLADNDNGYLRYVIDFDYDYYE